MRVLALIALAISLIFLSGPGWAQSSTPSDSSSTISTSADDPAFAQFPPLAKGTKPPKATFSPDPKCPDLPEGAEPRGTVVLLVGINAKGHVEPVRVVHSDEPAFEKTAVETVKKWKFKPAEKDGHPVPVRVSVEMKFQR